jgi:hypothetical protein
MDRMRSTGCVVAVALGLLACAARPDGIPRGAPRLAREDAGFDADQRLNGVQDPLEIRAPPQGWWEAERPCPAGTAVIVQGSDYDPAHLETVLDLPRIGCARPDGTRHGPSTMFARNGVAISQGFYRNGRKHGAWEEHSPTEPRDRGRSYWDDGVGVGTWASIFRGEVKLLEHRSSREIHRTVRMRGAVVEQGLLVDGLRQGPWTITKDGVTREVEFVDGRAAGASALIGLQACDDFLRRVSACLQGKSGAERYELASLLAFFVDLWEEDGLEVFPGRSEPICVINARNTQDELAEHDCE